MSMLTRRDKALFGAMGTLVMSGLLLVGIGACVQSPWTAATRAVLGDAPGVTSTMAAGGHSGFADPLGGMPVPAADGVPGLAASAAASTVQAPDRDRSTGSAGAVLPDWAGGRLPGPAGHPAP